MPELEPITREEKFLNGEVGMTPITREEKILAGEDVETITRREYFLKKYRGGGGGDVTVEEITITENGTTTAPSGKAYSPIHTNVPQPTLSTLEVSENGDYDAPSGIAYNRVEVDVPLPTNAYLLKSVANLPQAIASFNDGQDMVMPSLKVAIEPQQDLNGYDSPWAGGAGKNKYEGSPLFDEYVDKNKWTLQAEKYNGHDVYKKSTAWRGMYKLTYLDVGTYTFSCMCKTSDSATVFIFLKVDNVTTAITNVTQITNTSSTSWAKISGTFNVTSAGTLAIRVERSNDGDIYISEYQLESGSTATSFAPYSNICPISGWDEANVTVADDVETPTVSNVYTIDLDGTRYGDYIDWTNNNLVVTDGCKKVEELSWIESSDSTPTHRIWRTNISGKANGIDNMISESYKITTSSYANMPEGSFRGSNSANTIFVCDSNYTTASDFSTSMKDMLIVYELATPIVIPLQLPQVKTLEGVNNIWADTGDITDAEYFSKEV